VCTRTTDVSDDEPLSKHASDTCPPQTVWDGWAAFLESGWGRHAQAIAIPIEATGDRQYSIAKAGVRALCVDLCDQLAEPASRAALQTGAESWSAETVRGFVHHGASI
jgi:hypothetical protein